MNPFRSVLSSFLIIILLAIFTPQAVSAFWKKNCLKDGGYYCDLYAEELREKGRPSAEYIRYFIKACDGDTSYSCSKLADIYEKKNDHQKAIFYAKKECDCSNGSCFQLYLLINEDENAEEEALDAVRNACERYIDKKNNLFFCDHYRSELFKQGQKQEASEVALQHCNRFSIQNPFDRWLKLQKEYKKKSDPDLFFQINTIEDYTAACNSHIVWEFEKGNEDYALGFALSLCDQGDYHACAQAGEIAVPMGKMELAQSMFKKACTKNKNQFSRECSLLAKNNSNL